MTESALSGTRNAPGRASLRHLSAHGFDLAVQPGAGGRIVSLSYQGKDVFHPDPNPDDMKLLDSGCFPLVPFSNRIRDGRFEFDGHAYTLARNWDGDDNAIHGEGWTGAWTVTQQDDTSIRMWMAGTDWWPWAYECSHIIRLTPGRVVLSLTVTNLDTRAMPAGLGFHPYFPLSAETQLHFSATGAIRPMDDHPVRVEPLTAETDFSRLSGVNARDLDHGYAGWNGLARISQPADDLDITLRTNTTPAGAVIYI
ncbi:MAG: hypothetical protein RLN72_04635, partial [Henriciella sp.]